MPVNGFPRAPQSMALLKELRSLNPNLTTMLYMNALLLFPFYSLSGKYLEDAENTLLMDAGAVQRSLVKVALGNAWSINVVSNASSLLTALYPVRATLHPHLC